MPRIVADFENTGAHFRALYEDLGERGFEVGAAYQVNNGKPKGEGTIIAKYYDEGEKEFLEEQFKSHGATYWEPESAE